MKTMRSLAAAAAFSATVASAEAKVTFVSFEGATASQTVDPIGKGDSVVVLGQVRGPAGALTQTVRFVSKVAQLTMTVSWTVNTATSKIRTVGVNVDLFTGGLLVASDSFAGVLGGVAVSTLSVTGLVKGQTYDLLLTGTGSGEGASTYTIAIEPN